MMKYKCPYCQLSSSGIDWDSKTLMEFGQDKINDFSDNDIESIEMQIPGYFYMCPACGAVSNIREIMLSSLES